MLLCSSLGAEPPHPIPWAIQVAERLEASVTAALDAGYRTGDLMSPGCQLIGCSALGDLLLQSIEEPKLA